MAIPHCSLGKQFPENPGSRQPSRRAEVPGSAASGFACLTSPSPGLLVRIPVLLTDRRARKRLKHSAEKGTPQPWNAFSSEVQGDSSHGRRRSARTPAGAAQGLLLTPRTRSALSADRRRRQSRSSSGRRASGAPSAMVVQRQLLISRQACWHRGHGWRVH